MALRKLPLAVQSKFFASRQINTFKAAVEELVYNAFDADSTSIAIRIHIQENFIQIVDNGHGVAKNDLHQLGQRYFTSKFENRTANTTPKYGYYGQTLANIIEASESVNITSRCEDSEEAWMKYFYKGKPKDCLTKATRPSIGTTVEIIGFLYNMPIQRKTVKALQELQRIKVFLEQMSLVHCNTSISLRDNEENEIIFKIHKNRDIPQTLTSILGIDISNFQELQVEKNQYKVTAYIQKMSTESHGLQWIYLNKRVIDNCNLHKMVNQNLNKSIVTKKILKVKSHKNEEEKILLNKKIPDYFIFITCPHDDYNIISNPKQSMLEFKNWYQVNKLLEKLILFFNGSINVGKKSEVPVEQNKNDKDNLDTRNQVRQIMHKILGSYQKQHNGSQLHNGVKGKIVKRKMKKSIKEKTTKLKITKEDHNSIVNDIHERLGLVKQQEKPIEKSYNNENATSFKKKLLKYEITTQPSKRQIKCHAKADIQKTKTDIAKKDPVISKFEKETDEVKTRCHMLSKKAENMLDFKKKRNCKIFTNEIIEYSTVVKDKRKLSIRKKIDEVIIHEYLPLPQRKRKPNRDHANEVMKSYDLIHPVTTVLTKIPNNRPEPLKRMIAPPPVDIHEVNIPECDTNIPRLTYESHNYDKASQMRQAKEVIIESNNYFQFNSRTFCENLPSPKTQRKEFINNCRMKRKNSDKKPNLLTRKTKKYVTGNMFTSVSQTSYSIHFTGTELQSCLNKNEQNIQPDTVVPINEDTYFGSTHARIDSNKVPDNFDNTTTGTRRYREIPDLDGISPTLYSTHFTGTEYPSGLDENQHNTPIQTDALQINEKTEFGSTYTIIDSSKIANNVDNTTIGTTEIRRISGLDEASHITASNSNIHNYDFSKATPAHQNLSNDDVMTMENNNCNVVFVSNSQHLNDELNVNQSIDPLCICETILEEQTSGEYNFIFDSINNVLEANYYFQSPAVDDTNINDNNQENNQGEDNYFKNHVQRSDLQANPDFQFNFNIKNRRRFIPKGLSPIFENCNSKKVCDYEFDEEYFEENVYNNFAQDVQINTEIFEPTIQNVKELASKDIQRVKSKLSKESSCLTFNADALKDAQVLGQVDNKFIATKIKNASEKHCHLVLFDQHAVHERIRLETNMAEYLKGDQWKSATLDGIFLHLSKDDILYLHNCKDKFYRLGLEWNILNNTEVLLTAIPEAILGKHVRQVDVVLKAVKSLIKEVIVMIKEQGGCVSVYPKSIMELVFNEACRYAIMFGDVLSKDECSNLLNALSKCKTPFQCAHGRPVMAVLMDMKAEKRPYKVHFFKIQQFRRRIQKLNN